MGDVFIGFLAIFIAYLIWIKIKSIFTGRTFSQQADYDAARERQEVCRNCKHCLLGTSCEYFDWDIDANRDVCDYFEHR